MGPAETASEPRRRPRSRRRRRRKPRSHRVDEAVRDGARGARDAGLNLALVLLRELMEIAESVVVDLDAAPTWRERARAAVEGEAERLAVRPARLASTGLMLAKVTGGYRLHRFASRWMTEADRAASLRTIHARAAARFHETSVSQGGAFLKVGQLLSARPDLLPSEWIEQLSRLQDAAAPVPFEHACRVIEEDLGAPVDALFESLDPAPLASASIGQVHRGVALDGTPVAVKVQRPDVGELIDADMALLKLFLSHMSSMLPDGDYGTIANEVAVMVRGELDYVAEARAMDRAARLFEGMPGVAVPRTLPSLCSDRVLTAELFGGAKITDVLDRLSAAADATAHAELSDLLGRLLEVYLIQVLEEGAFQADPHPGNFLVTDEGTLVLLDFGCTKTLAPELRIGFGQLMQSFILGDRATMTRCFGELGFATESGSTDTLHLFAEVLLKQFRDAIAQRGRFAWPTKEQLLESSAELLEAMRRDPVVQIPAEFVMIGRVFGLLGGLFQHYQPDIDWQARVVPHVMRSMGPAAVTRAQ